LGFRGEALPSIASVCAFSLTTSTGQGAGTKVLTDGGGEVSATPASHPKGTTVLVDRLFYNVPARRAFLKSARAERAAIAEVMANLSIAHPRVMFRLTEKGRDVLSLPAAKDLLERLAQLYGVGKSRAMRRPRSKFEKVTLNIFSQVQSSAYERVSYQTSVMCTR
jgi:DNA mismatch repair protein MutL